MIAKGTTHNNGAKLARYMTTGKDGERAELWELCGFAAGDIRDAFRSVHVMAEATRCEQPFFHVQVRNPEGEELSRDQWRRVADRIESKLGLSGQPRAIAFHTDLATGHEHLHLAWSRIDGETMTARPLPFYKERLKEVSRELENSLDLTRVRNERDGSVLAPTRDEFEQARRLGVNIKDVRQTIRDCFERSDTGRSFEAALADHGFVLAQGDRRAFLVIDHEGGMHALGQRILGISAGQTRERLADLSRDELPTVEQATSFIREQQVSRERVTTPPMRDPVREEMAWLDTLAKAAIEKEKIERRFVEPTPEKEMNGSREKEGRVREETAHSTPDKFKDAALELAGSTGPAKPLKRIEKTLWGLYRSGPEANEFAGALDSHGIAFARVTPDEADKSYREAQFAKAVGRIAPVYQEGEIVVVRAPGPEYLRQGEWAALNRVQKLDQTHARKYLEVLRVDRSQLPGIDATKEKLNILAAERADHRARTGLENAQRQRDGEAPTLGKDSRVLGTIGKTSGRVISKTLDSITNAIESLFAPVPTPEQKREGELTARERAVDTAHKIDVSKHLANHELSSQRQEQEREAGAQRERNERER
jgi:hypothetical protein